MFTPQKIKLTDIIDLKFLQDFQDSFANATNVACLMVDDNGPITKPSNFTEFCIKLTRGCKAGYKNCNECDIKWGKIAAKNKKPVIYNCHTGLTDFAVPIVVNGKHIASILGGQILTHSPDKEKFRQISIKLGINEKAYLEALDKIKIVQPEQVKGMADLLFIVANSISELATKNLELKQKNLIIAQTVEKGDILRKIIEISRCSFDSHEVKQKIVEELGRAFNADRCYFRDFNKVQNKFGAPKEQYLGSSEIKSLLNVEPNQEAMFYFKTELERLKKGFSPISINLDAVKNRALREYMIDNNIRADYAIPIIDVNDECIWLVLHYSKDSTIPDESYIKLLEIIAFNIEKTLSQLKLLETLKQQAEREQLLRKITENIRSSLDIDETLNYVCDELAKVFKVQRATIIQFPNQNDYSDFIIRREYKSSKNIKGIVNNDNFNKDVGKIWAEYIEYHNQCYVVDNIQESGLSDIFVKNYTRLGQKSLIIAPIQQNFLNWGVIILSQYDYYRHWQEEEINFLQIISNQLYIAISQAELYNKAQEQMEREKTILNNLPFMVWLKDKDCKFLSVNEAFANACGSNTDVLIGKTDYDIWSEELASNYIKDDIEIMKMGKPKSIEEIINGQNGPRWYESYKAPLFNLNGEVIGITGCAQDITEKREINKLKNEFVSTVSHELRTPLTSLRGSLGLIMSGKMGELPEKVNALLDIANNNCTRLINLINDILDIEKIEAGKMDFDIKPYQLMPLVNQAIELNQHFAQKFSVQIKLVKEIKKEFVNVDPNRLIQVITNLLSNAIKFSIPQSSVDIEITKQKGKVKFSITNYGTEIPQNFKNKIFHKFAQADSSDSRQKGGTGLGLSISKSIIEKMDGTIDFISENTKTTFYFVIPECSIK